MRRKKDTKDDALQEPLDDGVEDPVEDVPERLPYSPPAGISPRSAAAVAARKCEWRGCEAQADELVPVGCEPYLPERQLDPPAKGGWRFLCNGHFDRLVVRDWDPGVC
jgi:hypothetical protein